MIPTPPGRPLAGAFSTQIVRVGLPLTFMRLVHPPRCNLAGVGRGGNLVLLAHRRQANLGSDRSRQGAKTTRIM